MPRTTATFVGIGAQKCASTWLWTVLGQMPEVRLAPAKEVDFFSARFDRGYEWYERQIGGASAHRHRGEISPSYLPDADAPVRAAAYNPGLVVFAILRDPVARAYSNHLHEVGKGHVTGANRAFETALANNPLYVGQGRYATHLRRWYDAFPADRIHVLFQEDIHADRPAAAAAVAAALGLPPVEALIDRRANESARYRSPALGHALWRLGKAGRDAGLGQVVETAKALPGLRHLRAANKESLRDVVPPMRSDTEARLAAQFAPEVERLEALIGRSVPWPRYGAARAAS